MQEALALGWIHKQSHHFLFLHYKHMFAWLVKSHRCVFAERGRCFSHALEAVRGFTPPCVRLSVFLKIFFFFSCSVRVLAEKGEARPGQHARADGKRCVRACACIMAARNSHKRKHVNLG